MVRKRLAAGQQMSFTDKVFGKSASVFLPGAAASGFVCKAVGSFFLTVSLPELLLACDSENI